MKKQPETKQTGPLGPVVAGHFSFRDGVWFLKPAQPVVKK